VSRLNVAIVAPSTRILGGQAVQAARLLHSWRADPDIRAWLVPINPTPPGPFAALTRVKYVRTLATQLCYWPLLVRELRRADVVHVFSASYFSFLLAPLPAVLIAKLLGKPVVMNYRSGEAPDHLRRSAIARTTLRNVDRNAVPSRFLQEVFATFGIRSQIIPNIVDVERFRFRRRERLRPRVLSTRNFERLYNLSCTLRAFRLLQDRHPDAQLTLVGGGTQESAIRELVTELKLENVTFAGRVPPDDIWRYYADADIYLQTPDVDNMPTSVLEAYASGCAVVSTNAGGVPAILTDGENGLLVPCNDHRGAADAMLRLLEDHALARRLTEAALEGCVRFQWSAVCTGIWSSSGSPPQRRPHEPEHGSHPPGGDGLGRTAFSQRLRNAKDRGPPALRRCASQVASAHARTPARPGRGASGRRRTRVVRSRRLHGGTGRARAPFRGAGSALAACCGQP
jgi:glycosyltransferase involved in cell wall biosynthesis